MQTSGVAMPTVWYDENISAIFDQQMITATHLPFGWPELLRWFSWWRTASTVCQDETTPNYENQVRSCWQRVESAVYLEQMVMHFWGGL